MQECTFLPLRRRGGGGLSFSIDSQKDNNYLNIDSRDIEDENLIVYSGPQTWKTPPPPPMSLEKLALSKN